MNTQVFSPTETKVLKILGKKKATITELADTYFEKGKKPYDPNGVISSAVLRINRKCKYHNLDWFLNGEGLGRGGRTVWKEKNS